MHACMHVCMYVKQDKKGLSFRFLSSKYFQMEAVKTNLFSIIQLLTFWVSRNWLSRKMQRNQLKYAMNQRWAKFANYIDAFLKKLDTVFNAVSINWSIRTVRNQL